MVMQPKHNNLFERRRRRRRPPITNAGGPTIKWFKEWVPRDVVTTGGKSLVLKWVNEATLKAMKEKLQEPDTVEPEPEPTTEVLFLCSFENCGKTFIDVGALRKHSLVHGARQYVCHYKDCGKKFLDSSKLKRHFLIHTGERNFICLHEGCGKAFSLDFNLKSHMKTHSKENYHICPYNDCGKRYAHGYKLKNHISSQHEKSLCTHAPVSSDRPYGCPYDGCKKAYIHEYKLKHHLKREHFFGSDQDVSSHGKRASCKVIQKQSKPASLKS